VEEAVASGIEEIIFVTSIGKRAIEDHFDRNFELEYRLAQKHKTQALAEVSAIGKLARFAFVRQTKPLGDGHAILSALPFIDLHEPVAVLFGDDIISGRVPALRQMMDAHETYGDPVVALQQVPKKDTGNYGVIGGVRVETNTYDVKEFVEKPAPEKAPSNLAVVGRYVLTPAIYAVLKKQKPGKDGEIRLADAFVTHLENGHALYGRVFEGTRYDCGNKLGFLKAQVELGLAHPETGKALRAYLKTLK
jgi:UTP--glucose-1-phosphate uridylyltransferase